MIAENDVRLIQREVKSPRAAAFAGIVFSIMSFFIMITTYSIRVDPESITKERLQNWSDTASIVIALVPFAGIAFLWFTGVVRDRLRYQEGSFFATIFFGSGLIYVTLIFIWSAILGAIMATMDMNIVISVGNGIHAFGFVLMDEIVGNYSLRMAGVYMTAIGALWSRTNLMPRWLTIITYVLALGFLIAAEKFREARFIFPTWVLVVSVYILILNYRRTHNSEIQDGLTEEE